ncbi:hypothetical protein [Microcoleus vaginatus]|uniref:hypothetical protein n=1 Tax=Microcoleus vaginatus TaxID=119532 RepID=UPI0016870FEC|nr:hypothetical protein [Microcoleus sp. FACHB-84]MBD2010688.1 hypothetical protein [Microcoleus sp. FACHB-45]
MKAESEVSISFAISIFLDKEFTPDDDTLNNESYKELGLTCGKCRELIFFKPGRKRVSHFSHFKDTGKGCRWRTESHSNTQDSDSSKREQSLQEFQTKFKGIIERAIIQYQKISSSQLLSQIVNGKILVAEYNINIEAWLRWFNENRNKVEKVALALYQKNDLLSDMNSKVLLNLLDYLCVPASEYILRDLLYYVVFLLNKERGFNNNLEKVCSKVIEIISFADWKKEYKRAKELVDTSKFEQEAHKEIVDFREYEIAPITFKGIDHPNVEEKTPKSQIQVEQKTPKPIKLENEKVVIGAVDFTDVIGTVPMILRLTPSINGWNLSGLPIKLSDEVIYDLARYITNNLGGISALAYLNSEINRLKTLESGMVGKVTRHQLIKMLNTLCDGIIDDKKIDSQHILESKNRLKKYLTNHDFLASPTDNYFRFYYLGKVAIIQELELEKYTYILTNFGDDRALVRNNLPSVRDWLRRVTRNLSEYFGKKKPSFDEIEYYLKSTFKYKNVDLKFYQSNRMFFEIYYQGESVAKQLITIVDPVSNNKNYGITPTKVGTRIEFSDKRIFKQFLKCSDADFDLIKLAQNQLRKVVNKFLSANRHQLIGENKTATPTKDYRVRRLH